MERQDYYTYKSFTENFIIGRSLLNCSENTQLDDTHSILDFLKSINKDKDKDKEYSFFFCVTFFLSYLFS